MCLSQFVKLIFPRFVRIVKIDKLVGFILMKYNKKYNKQVYLYANDNNKDFINSNISVTSIDDQNTFLDNFDSIKSNFNDELEESNTLFSETEDKIPEVLDYSYDFFIFINIKKRSKFYL